MPLWKPDASLLEQLGPAKTLEGYHVRLPKDYHLEESTQGRTKGLIAQGPLRPDGSAAKFTFIVGHLTWQGETLSLERGLDRFLASVKADFEVRHETVTQVDTAKGTIDGQTFVREQFMISLDKSKRVHWIAYYAQDENRYLYMMAQDNEPHDKESLPLLETAALTFAKD